ncbi:mitotic-spindle organizing protein 1B-like [Fagus crenata]
MDPEAARTARESLDLAFHMSNILDTGLDRHTLCVLIALCDLSPSHSLPLSKNSERSRNPFPQPQHPLQLRLLFPNQVLRLPCVFCKCLLKCLFLNTFCCRFLIKGKCSLPFGVVSMFSSNMTNPFLSDIADFLVNNGMYICVGISG